MSAENPFVQKNGNNGRMESVFGEKNLESAQTFEDFIEAVDFDALNRIFDSIALKSERDGSRKITKDIIINHVSANFGQEETGVAGADIENFQIHFSWSEVKRRTNEFGEKMSVGVAALHMLIHEMVHLYARTESSDLKEGDARLRVEDGASVLLTGLEDRQTGVSGERSKLGVKLNEAVTEQIALQVFDTYLHRTGDRYLIRNDIDGSEDLNREGYLYERVLLNVVIQTLAESVGLKNSEDVVWHGFVQAYMNGNQAVTELMDTVGKELEASDVAQPAAKILLKMGEGSDIDEKLVVQLRENPEMKAAIEKTIATLKPEQVQNLLGIH